MQWSFSQSWDHWKGFFAVEPARSRQSAYWCRCGAPWFCYPVSRIAADYSFALLSLRFYSGMSRMYASRSRLQWNSRKHPDHVIYPAGALARSSSIPFWLLMAFFCRGGLGSRARHSPQSFRSYFSSFRSSSVEFCQLFWNFRSHLRGLWWVWSIFELLAHPYFYTQLFELLVYNLIYCSRWGQIVRLWESRRTCDPFGFPWTRGQAVALEIAGSCFRVSHRNGSSSKGLLSSPSACPFSNPPVLCWLSCR